MNLFLLMLPFYLIGNLHCMGMCGPLALMLSQHPYRFLYFVGRLCSFSLAGLLAGYAGEVINLFLHRYYLAAGLSFIFGITILILGLFSVLGKGYPGSTWLEKRLSTTNKTLSLLVLKGDGLSTFLFGFFTILLPCGQTLVVFSACALSGESLTGFVNGFAFALLTSPALLIAMKAGNMLRSIKKHYHWMMGVSAIFVGVLSIFRAIADLSLIDHLILNETYHIVLY